MYNIDSRNKNNFYDELFGSELKFNCRARDGDILIKNVTMEILKVLAINDRPQEIVDKFVAIYSILEKYFCVENRRQVPKDTVFDDYIICLEDGKKMKMLNRHLKVKYGMTFSEYKRKWNLPIDYPSTCKNYSKVRADIAKKRCAQ